MALRLKNSSGNFIALDAPSSIATDVTLTLPNTDGDSGQYLQTNGAGALSWQTVATGTQWTESSASLTGASQEWTGIPSTARQIIITHQGWSNASSSQHWCQIGDSGGFEATGYYTGNVFFGNATGGTDYDNQSAFIQGQATDPSTAVTGTIILSRLNNSNQWTILWHYSPSNGYLYAAVGNKALSDTLDRVRILPSTGNFDAGIANLMYLS
jgi:hypothetical protein